MIKLILMAALLFVSGASMAQKVVLGKNGEAIIDNSGMPAKSITTAKKPRETDGTNSKPGTNNIRNLSSQESNKTVSYYFEVAKTDFDNSNKKNWLAAIEGCASYDSGDGKLVWRAPTQREMMLIWTLHATLIQKIPSFVKIGNSYYWTATETNTGQAWHMVIADNQNNSGFTFNNASKDGHAFQIRCIRDLALTTK